MDAVLLGIDTWYAGCVHPPNSEHRPKSVDQAPCEKSKPQSRCTGHGAPVRSRCTAVTPVTVPLHRSRRPEIANLSIGCEGIVHQFALATGTPQFCHVSHLGKTVSALPGGKVVYSALLRPSSLHHFETRVRVRSLEDMRRETRLDALKGILAKSGRVKEEEAARTFITTAAETKGESRTPTKTSAGEAKEATTPGGVEVEGTTSGARPKPPLVTGVYRERLFIYVDTPWHGCIQPRQPSRRILAQRWCTRYPPPVQSTIADAETVLQTRRLQTERLRWDNGPTTGSEYICRRGDRVD
jgi:hypothetical protein